MIDIRAVRVIVLAGCLLTPIMGVTEILTGPVTNPANGHEYYLLKASRWSEAQAQAQALGGNLVTINNAAENDWVQLQFSRHGNVMRNLWIGLYDPDISDNSAQQSIRRGEFRWVSGEPVRYTNWSPHEPNNPASEDPLPRPEAFVHIWNPADPFRGTWNNFLDGNSLLDTPVNGVVEIASENAASPIPTGKDAQVFSATCVTKSNINAEICDCVAGLAADELSDLEYNMVLASNSGDKNRAAALIREMNVAQVQKAGMFMPQAIRRCANP